jgi:hypothetical protein
VLCAGSTLLLVQSYAPDEAPYINLSGAVAKPASINLRKLALSRTGSINLGFILREDLLLCSSYLPSSWGSQLGGHLHAISAIPMVTSVVRRIVRKWPLGWWIIGNSLFNNFFRASLRGALIFRLARLTKNCKYTIILNLSPRGPVLLYVGYQSRPMYN